MPTKYQDAVAEARRLVKRSEEDQWRLAELTWEQVEAGKTIAQWAEDIGVSRRTAQAWRQVWTRWGVQDLHDRPAWAEAYEQVNPSGATPASLDRAVHNMSPERKAEIARDLLADPSVADEVVKDREARDTFIDADLRHTAQERGLPELGDRVVEPMPMDYAYEASRLAERVNAIVADYGAVRMRWADDPAKLARIATKIEPEVNELSRIMQGDLLLDEGAKR